ncbi:unnamed protein product [Choristocarpus tenellus]|uniref:NADH dehydrogenase subunit 6 n=1 Tax=Choristocarpus tenellus TaxID=116065 RepID=UPI002E7A991F|nr:NADH dehydrogenase subunit 6 [Choristocarpus tenellus]WBP69828.1 NADH dehydrogenase subunit 6 [Choristocarpus tenellus]
MVLDYVYFSIFGSLILGLSLKVVTTQNPVYSVLYLVLVFILSSIFVLSLGLDFIALFFVLVYVGAIAVLFLFVVIILDIKLVEYPTPITFILFFLLILAIYISNFGFFRLGQILNNYPGFYSWIFEIPNLYMDFKYKEYHIPRTYSHCLALKFDNTMDYWSCLFALDFKFLKINFWLNSLDFTTSAKNLGHVLYTYHIILFIIGGIILLISIVGAISLSLQVNKTESLTRQLGRQPNNAIFLTVSSKTKIDILTFRDLEVWPPISSDTKENSYFSSKEYLKNENFY